MDILFRKKYSYAVASSYEDTRATFEAILNGKWYDFSNAYTGTLEEDGSFTFRQKMAIMTGSLFRQARVMYMEGKLIQNDNGTVINISLCPNLVLVFAIYLLALVSLNILFGDNSFMGIGEGRLHNIIELLIIEIILFGVIQAGAFLLRSKFERVIIEKIKYPRKSGFPAATPDKTNIS